MKLDKIDIYDIDNFIFYRIAKTNKTNEYYLNIRIAIIEEKEKYYNITLSKYSI